MAWQIDPAHSQIQFSVRHMMISTVHGRFGKFTGTVEFNEAEPAASSLEVHIDPASIDTRDPQRDGHLKSPDFFDAQQYPDIIFKGTKFEVLSEERGRITGDLTIRGVTRPVVLDVEYNGQARSPWGTTSAGFSATTRFSRKEWGLTWNQALETGGMLVGDDVKVSIEVELVKQPEAKAESAQA